MTQILRALLVAASITAAPLFVCAAESPLWGRTGETWDPNGRLPDFSRAGYREGEAPIPECPVVADVRDFGAAGDGVNDDTAAIQAAINQAKDGAVLLPPGRYKITDQLLVSAPGVVLRGAGPERTTLWFPRGLDAVRPRERRTSTGERASGYSFEGAYVTIKGDYRATELARITRTSRRGERELQLDRTTGLRPGTRVQITVEEDAAQSLKTYLYCGDPGDIARGKPLPTRMVAVVETVDEKTITLDRPLRFETRPEWQPRVRAFDPKVTECGIEGLRFEFENVPYGGHFKENGANAIELDQVYACWVRDVVIHNADLGINVMACGNTLDRIVLTADSSRGVKEWNLTDCSGHHAIQCKVSEDNLITRFDVRAPFLHDLSVENASGNVFADGRGIDLNLDHHKDTPYQNLFTDLDCGRATRVWRSGGGASLGRPCAGWATVWGVTAAHPIAPPKADWAAPCTIFVGVLSHAPAAMNERGVWWEPGEIEPRNLYRAQLTRRLKSAPQP